MWVDIYVGLISSDHGEAGKIGAKPYVITEMLREKPGTFLKISATIKTKTYTVKKNTDIC